MQFVLLLRGINVGGNKRVDMKHLKTLCKKLGYTNVSTYINSGNVIFESQKNSQSIWKEFEQAFKKEFGFEVPLLVKTLPEMQKIAKAIPSNWTNGDSEKSDVAYLFEQVDSKKIIDELPMKKEYLDIRYVKGALLWNVKRENYNKSHLNKIISHKLYAFMTVRNVNTARFLAGKKEKTPRAKKEKVSPQETDSLDAYIASFSKDVQAILQKVRKTIHKAAPEAEEAISYGMPTFKLNGKNLVHFAAWKSHIGFYATPSGNTAFKKELSVYKGAKGSVQFPLDEPMPYDLIKKIVLFRVKEVQKKK